LAGEGSAQGGYTDIPLISGEFRLIFQLYEKGNLALAQTRVFAMCSELVIEPVGRHQVKQKKP